MKRFTFVFIILLSSVLRIYARKSLEKFVSTQLKCSLGSSVHVTLIAHAKENAKVEFPVFKPTQYITPGVEVLGSWSRNRNPRTMVSVARSTIYTLTSLFDDTLLLPATYDGED